MGFGCKYHLYLGLTHKAVAILGSEYKSLCLLITDGESSLGGWQMGDGKKANQKLLWDEEK